MTLAKNNKLIKIQGTSEQVWGRIFRLVHSSGFSRPFTDKDLAELLSPGESYVMYEVGDDAPYTTDVFDKSVGCSPRLKVLI